MTLLYRSPISDKLWHCTNTGMRDVTEAVDLDRNIDFLERAFSSQPRGHSEEANRLAKDCKMAENINASSLADTMPKRSTSHGRALMTISVRGPVPVTTHGTKEPLQFKADTTPRRPIDYHRAVIGHASSPFREALGHQHHPPLAAGTGKSLGRWLAIPIPGIASLGTMILQVSGTLAGGVSLTEPESPTRKAGECQTKDSDCGRGKRRYRAKPTEGRSCDNRKRKEELPFHNLKKPTNLRSPRSAFKTEETDVRWCSTR